MSPSKQLLETIEVNPQTTPIASVIWLHGLGADGNDFLPIIDEMNLPHDLPVRFIFPNAPLMPVTINNGYVMRAWYDIVSLEIDNHADHSGISRSTEQLQHLINNEVARGVPTEKIILAGFSQGAVIALTTGLTYPKPLAGILALSGYLPFADKIFQNASINNKNTPIFLAHGTQDPVVPFFLGQSTQQLLAQHHYPVSWHSYPMPHSVCMEEISDIKNWLVSCIQ